MGKPAPTSAVSPQQHHYTPDDVPMGTTRSDYEYDDVPDLPSYTESEAAATQPTDDDERPVSRQARLAEEQPMLHPGNTQGWRVYAGNQPRRYNGTTIRMDDRLKYAENLYAYITDYLQTVPPKPAVRIEGWHNTTVERHNKKERERVVDFDITLSLQSYLPIATPGAEHGGWQPRVVTNNDRVHRGSWRRTVVEQDHQFSDEPERDLMQWCDDFCDSKAKLTIFRVTRDVPGLDKDLLRMRLQALIRSTNYRGHIDVSFPIADKNVDVYSPHPINKWRISWVRFLFYVTMLWIITWPILFFTTKRWEVYKVSWCFSWQQDDGIGGVKKRYATISEQSWYEKHANLIINLALDSYQGDASGLPIDAYHDGSVQREPNASTSASETARGDTLYAVQRGAVRDVGDWGADS